jgi:uncharacterized protein YidB (DUF937 family)
MKPNVGDWTDTGRTMVDPSGVSTRADLHEKLQELFDGYGGSFLALGTAAGVGQATVHDMVSGKAFPRWSTLERVLIACGISRGELEVWHHAHARAQTEGRSGPGRLLSEMTDPFALEVHRPIQAEDIHLPALPQYVRRDHDDKLAEIIDQAVSGCSMLAVLVGESSTGKTRACWEALTRLRSISGRQEWRLWHPIDPSRPDAALASLTEVGPHTVVWLNEAQFYLDTALGEQVAAGLRELLRTPKRSPVLILATLWPVHWDTLTIRPDHDTDLHAQARELLLGRKIHVPAVFTGDDTAQLVKAAADDARIAQARAHAADGRIIQYLAGVPALLDRYHEAPPAARALIHGAMDARRLGHGPHLPRQLLADAAHGYLDDTEWNSLDDDWIDAAFAYAVRPCNGILGPLTRVRPRTSASGSPLYRLADYLEQVGRTQRANQYPPDSFWAAATGLAHHGSLYSLGRAAVERGLLQTAAQLWKRAASCGHASAAAEVVELLTTIHPHDSRPAQWAVQVSPLHDPGGIGHLLSSLQDAGADGQISALLKRNPAGHARLHDPGAVNWLLKSVSDAEAYEQVTVLIERDPACHVSLEDLGLVGRLLVGLHKAGADEQVAALAERAARHAPLDNPRAAGWLLNSLQQVRASEQVTTLAERIAQQVSLDNPGAVTYLLRQLNDAGAYEQVAVLVERDPAHHVSLGDLDAVEYLLGALGDLWVYAWVTEMLEHVARHRTINLPDAEQLLSRVYVHHTNHRLLRDVATMLGICHYPIRQQVAPSALHSAERLLESIRRVRYREQRTALLERVTQQMSIDDPGTVGWLIVRLREQGANDRVAALLKRDPARHVRLDDPRAVGWLLIYLHSVAQVEKTVGSLREVDASGQLATLLKRDPARHVALDDPGAVGRLLGSLRHVAAHEQVATLLWRKPAQHASLDDPGAVGGLLRRLHEAGANEQAATLAERVTQHAFLNIPQASWLLDSMRHVGANRRADLLLRLLPVYGQFQDDFLENQNDPSLYRYGCQQDSEPASPWTWDDLG